MVNENLKSKCISFESLPKNFDEFEDLFNKRNKEPHYVVALAVAALCLWPEDKNAAVKILNLLKGPETLSPYDIQFISERLSDREYLPYSYFKGSNPENEYTADKPYTIEVTVVPTSFAEKDYIKFYLLSSGADSMRPITVREKPSTGQWFLWQQNLLSQIRIPTSEDVWK